MKLIKTDIFGIGIGYDFVSNELSIHLFYWSVDFKFNK